MGQDRAPNEEKFKELLIYIALCSEGDDSFGAVKLNKLLFLSDYLAYLRLGKAMTWLEYQALPNGPAPTRLVPIREELRQEGAIAERLESYFGYEQNRILALRRPNLKLFSPEEVDIVRQTVDHWWGRNASEISDFSHRFLGWRLANQGETIPYGTALIGSRKPSRREMEHGLSLADEAASLLV